MTKYLVLQNKRTGGYFGLILEPSMDTPTPIYEHPNIYALTHEQLLDRLQQIRDRRLVAAIQFEAVRKTKLERLSAKLQQQWEAQNLRNQSALDKIDEAIDRLDRGIAKQIQIAHNVALTDGEFEL